MARDTEREGGPARGRMQQVRRQGRPHSGRDRPKVRAQHPETAFGEDDGKWLPDPDMIFDPHEDGYVSPMEAAELKCRKLLDEIRNDLLALRPTAGK